MFFSIYKLWIICLALLLCSCNYSKNFTTTFFVNNEQKLNNIKNSYQQLYKQAPFAVLFENKAFTEIGLEIITPDIKYVYHFDINDPNLTDTLSKYNFNAPAVINFLQELKGIGGTWITQVDYYEDYQKKNLVLMAVRNKALNNTFKGESYCLLTFFNSPQVFDKKGRIVDRQERSLKKQVNGYLLYRVNDFVGYSIAKKYR